MEGWGRGVALYLRYRSARVKYLKKDMKLDPTEGIGNGEKMEKEKETHTDFKVGWELKDVKMLRHAFSAKELKERSRDCMWRKITLWILQDNKQAQPVNMNLEGLSKGRSSIKRKPLKTDFV